ncbi:outer membrane protein assembly factor BamB family protein [Streptomyces xanthophaeus]|uniref:outer membrane protein assembly factor BamB family protein n=1 Tax=Streptomyces xanthophaeus TaxID=67385 RepID=UPI002649A79E|nr:PQQ-binding-like beta-propeller repeat protein [Streptomyces xanthophaeus]WKD34300.1 PQQ-like beta-propeller repeat protein [Streptomyces xanthophaeus]
MSIPPPPSQPPSGGFGAPQDPPPGGFGAPVPPPEPTAAQPAYGYPQTGPGYGYPQQPGTPSPYGAPGAPGGAPVPAPQPPAPAPAGGNDKRTQLTIVGAAVLAIVLIVGGGLWYTSGDSGGGSKADSNPSASPGNDKPQDHVPGTEKVPGNPKSKPLFNLPSPVPAEIAVVAGSWLTDSTYIKSDLSKVVGYNLVDGGKKWELPFPGELCGATKHVSENKAAVLFKASQPTPENKYIQCTEVGVIDLESGKLVWSGNAKSVTGGDKPVVFSSVTLSGKTVAAAGISAGGAAWNLADGKSLWLPKVDGEGCRDVGYGGGEALAAIRKCGQSPNYTLYGQLLDPATGAPTASYKLSQGIEDAYIVATKPLIVAADVGKTAKNATGISDLFVVDPKGELKARIPLASGDFGGKCGSEVEKCTNMVVGNGKLYLPSYEHQGQASSGRTNELLSFDLETGKQTTDRADAGERYTMFPLRMDGSNIIAYKNPPYDKGGQIVSIDGKTMKETVLMENPADKASQRAETGFSPEYSEYRYHNGKFFISRTTVAKPYSDKADPEYLFVSFTAS